MGNRPLLNQRFSRFQERGRRYRVYAGDVAPVPPWSARAVVWSCGGRSTRGAAPRFYRGSRSTQPPRHLHRTRINTPGAVGYLPLSLFFCQFQKQRLMAANTAVSPAMIYGANGAAAGAAVTIAPVAAYARPPAAPTCIASLPPFLTVVLTSYVGAGVINVLMLSSFLQHPS